MPALGRAQQHHQRIGHRTPRLFGLVDQWPSLAEEPREFVVALELGQAQGEHPAELEEDRPGPRRLLPLSPAFVQHGRGLRHLPVPGQRQTVREPGSAGVGLSGGALLVESLAGQRHRPAALGVGGAHQSLQHDDGGASAAPVPHRRRGSQPGVGDVEPRDNAIAPAAVLRGVGQGQRQLHAHRTRRQGVAQGEKAGGQSLVEEPEFRRLQQRRRRGGVVGPEQRSYGVVPQVVVGVPLGRASQDLALVRRFGSRAGDRTEQGVAEQVVAAEPDPLRVQGDDEQTLGVQSIQPRGGPGGAQSGVAERTGQPVQVRRAQQEIVLVGGEGRQHLGREVVEQVTIVGKPGPGSVCSRPLGQGDELQTGRPTFGSGPRQGGRGGADVGADEFGDHRLGLGGFEAQVVGAQFGQLATGPQPSDRQRWVLPAADDQAGRRRQVGEQVLHLLVHRLVLDQVEVVEDDGVGDGRGGQLVQQQRNREVERPESGRE